jgi:hypothetical protein
MIDMPVKYKTAPPKVSSSIRQSVTIPAPLAVAVRRVAKERQLTISRALVSLAQKGVLAEREEKKSLKASYRRFLEESDPRKKDEAGRDLIRSIFGETAIAED